MCIENPTANLLGWLGQGSKDPAPQQAQAQLRTYVKKRSADNRKGNSMDGPFHGWMPRLRVTAPHVAGKAPVEEMVQLLGGELEGGKNGRTKSRFRKRAD